jgi:hypothetical protein
MLVYDKELLSPPAAASMGSIIAIIVVCSSITCWDGASTSTKADLPSSVASEEVVIGADLPS